MDLSVPPTKIDALSLVKDKEPLEIKDLLPHVHLITAIRQVTTTFPPPVGFLVLFSSNSYYIRDQVYTKDSLHIHPDMGNSGLER